MGAGSAVFLILDIFRDMEIKNEKNEQKFYCEFCNFKSCYQSDFDRHCATRKHQNFQFRKCPEIKKREKRDTGFECQLCNQTFQTNSGLWKHQQKCSLKSNGLVEYLIKENAELKTTMMQVIEKKDESMMKLMDQKEEKLTKLVIELCKNSQNVTNNTMINSNNNSNNNNNTFNLQLFLNETCKDALNLSDFVKTLKSSFADIEKVGSAGYVDGTSEVIIKHLNNLGVEKRPIQCTDAKRQTLYIKEDNQWTKEDPDLRRLQWLVDEVQRINLRVLPLWREKHPACLTSNSIHTSTYNNMSQELMGGDCSNVRIQAKDHKIINKIIKEVVIDKQMFLDNK